MDAKLHLLKFTRSQASSATENGNLTSMERVRKTLLKVQELQFGAGHQGDEMQIDENRKNLKK